MQASPGSASRTRSGRERNRPHAHDGSRRAGGRRLTRESDAFFVGVDGGGSRCRVRVADGVGRIVASAEGGGANVYHDFEAALATVEGTIAAACAGLDLARPHGVAVGLAGAAAPAVAARIEARLARPARRVVVGSDALIACLGAHAGRDGGLVVAGTGSAALLYRDGREVVIGGRGAVLGDDGSGSLLGRRAWRRAVRAHDGLEPWTPLLRALMAEHGDDATAVVAWARSATPALFARYAPAVMAAARAGDPAGLALAREAAEAVAELVLALAGRASPRTSLVGGLAAPLRPFLPERARAHLSPPLRDALDGALIRAGAPLTPRS